jgi:hypothetical protein
MVRSEAVMKGLFRVGMVVLTAAFIILPVIALAIAQSSNDSAQSASGLTAYLGVVPAQIVRGHRGLHGGAPSGPHQYHFVVAIFETTDGKRVSDAAVTIKISGLGLSGSETTLEPMEIADTVTYGGFFYLPGADLYTVRVTIRRSESGQPVVVNFKYDHRR